MSPGLSKSIVSYELLSTPVKALTIIGLVDFCSRDEVKQKGPGGSLGYFQPIRSYVLFPLTTPPERAIARPYAGGAQNTPYTHAVHRA